MFNFKILVLATLFLFSGSFVQKPAKPKIIYVYDALCGWCFGFSPVMAKFGETYNDKVDIEVISGGLKLGKSVGTINEVAPFIKTAYKDVESHCGVRFGAAFVNGPLKTGNMVLNSLPPAIAMAIVKERSPEKALKFAAMLQNMIYVDGKEPENLEEYGAYAEKLGFDKNQFLAKMKDPIYIQKAQKEFDFAQSIGATSFPAVFIEKNGKREMLVNGYVSYDKLKQLVSKVVKL